MEITVKLFAIYRVGRFKQQQCSYPPGTSCRQVAIALGIPEEQFGVAMVDGRAVDFDQPLADGNSLSLLPLVSGG